MQRAHHPGVFVGEFKIVLSKSMSVTRTVSGIYKSFQSAGPRDIFEGLLGEKN